MHDAAVVLAVGQPEGVAKLVHGLLERPKFEQVPVGGGQAVRGDHSGPAAHVGLAEDEVEGVDVQVDVRDAEDPVRGDVPKTSEEVVRTELPTSGVEGSQRKGLRGMDDDVGVEAAELPRETFQQVPRHVAEGDDGQGQPFITPMGRSRATIFVRPAPWATRTTSSTFL